jgi:hypothetical protein
MRNRDPPINRRWTYFLAKGKQFLFPARKVAECFVIGGPLFLGWFVGPCFSVDWWVLVSRLIGGPLFLGWLVGLYFSVDWWVRFSVRKVAECFVLCAMLGGPLVIFLLFFNVEHCIVNASSIYVFWLPIWYLQNFVNVILTTVSRLIGGSLFLGRLVAPCFSVDWSLPVSRLIGCSLFLGWLVGLCFLGDWWVPVSRLIGGSLFLGWLVGSNWYMILNLNSSNFNFYKWLWVHIFILC